MFNSLTCLGSTASSWNRFLLIRGECDTTGEATFTQQGLRSRQARDGGCPPARENWNWKRFKRGQVLPSFEQTNENLEEYRGIQQSDMRGVPSLMRDIFPSDRGRRVSTIYCTWSRLRFFFLIRSTDFFSIFINNPWFFHHFSEIIDNENHCVYRSDKLFGKDKA